MVLRIGIDIGGTFTDLVAINAVIQPAVRAYLSALQAKLEALGITAKLRLMQSNGGLAAAEFAAAQPRIVESGPAAGSWAEPSS